MKKLSDYKGAEAVELWADLLDPIIEIVGDPEIQPLIRSKQPPLKIAQAVIKKYSEPACAILLRIDPTEIDGLNVVTRLVDVMYEVMENPTVQSFFPSVAGAKKAETPSGCATESTEDTQTTSSNM
jgi:hypothetical protein